MSTTFTFLNLNLLWGRGGCLGAPLVLKECFANVAAHWISIQWLFCGNNLQIMVPRHCRLPLSTHLPEYEEVTFKNTQFTSQEILKKGVN